jgi:hypothetical protein
VTNRACANENRSEDGEACSLAGCERSSPIFEPLFVLQLSGADHMVRRPIHSRDREVPRQALEVSAYSVKTPNRVHVAAGQYLYCTSPSTSPMATKPIARLSRELFRLSPSMKHIPSGTFAWG